MMIFLYKVHETMLELNLFLRLTAKMLFTQFQFQKSFFKFLLFTLFLGFDWKLKTIIKDFSSQYTLQQYSGLYAMPTVLSIRTLNQTLN